MTLTKVAKNEKHKNNLTQSSQRTKNRDMRGPKFTLGGTAPLRRPSRKTLSFPKGALDPIYMFYHFNFLAVTVFELRYDISHIYTRGRCAFKTPLAKKSRGPNFTLGALHPGTPLAEKIVVSEKCT